MVRVFWTDGRTYRHHVWKNNEHLLAAGAWWINWAVSFYGLMTKAHEYANFTIIFLSHSYRKVMLYIYMHVGLAIYCEDRAEKNVLSTLENLETKDKCWKVAKKPCDPFRKKYKKITEYGVSHPERNTRKKPYSLNFRIVSKLATMHIKHLERQKSLS